MAQDSLTCCNRATASAYNYCSLVPSHPSEKVLTAGYEAKGHTQYIFLGGGGGLGPLNLTIRGAKAPAPPPFPQPLLMILPVSKMLFGLSQNV